MKEKDKTRFKHKSFYMTPSDSEMLEYLALHWGLNESAVIRRCLTEAYTVKKFTDHIAGDKK